MNPLEEIELWLREDGQLAPGPATLTPFTGGVSCEIYRVDQADRTFVIKRALAKLRVAAEWFADVSRNAVEYAFYHEMEPHLAGSLPQVFFHNPERGYFLMEFLGAGWRNWKECLIEGIREPAHGALAGTLMGRFHACTWGDARLEKLFDTTPTFRQLRTDTFLRTAAESLPEVRVQLLAEADRLEASRLCLVHGDFSPKNLMLHGDRMILLDAEVAWFGDPAFDVAFLHTHLFLKELRFGGCLPVSAAAWTAYVRELDSHADADLEFRCVRLLAMIMLARVNGKSPVEHLNPAQQQAVRNFCVPILLRGISKMEEIRASWQTHLHSS